ncbi:hypothetical protein BH24BAC1_BH24BAC1_20840 [soil metagenome]
MRLPITFFVLALILLGCGSRIPAGYDLKGDSIDQSTLRVTQDEKAGTISVFRQNEPEPILTQNAQEGIRPFLHPLLAPDGRGTLTEYRPAHHKHQTGLYWGLKMVNGRDFFMNGFGDYWRRVSAEVIESQGPRVKWRTVYDLLDEKGLPIMREIQTWSLQDQKGQYVLDLEWQGEAKTEIAIGQFYVGGLFLRMPWRKGIPGEVVNAAGQRNEAAEQQRAIWTDIGLQVEGREDLAHIAILDHPLNKGFPTAWRVDGELGVGPSRQILGAYTIHKGEKEKVRYRLLVYTGKLQEEELNQAWENFSRERL